MIKKGEILTKLSQFINLKLLSKNVRKNFENLKKNDRKLKIQKKCGKIDKILKKFHTKVFCSLPALGDFPK